MKINQRHVQIAGSANSTCDIEKLKYAHRLVSLLAEALLWQGASISAQIGKEPKHHNDDSLSIIFDWTIINVISEVMKVSETESRVINQYPLTTVTTEKTDGHIPSSKQDIWKTLRAKPAVKILDHPQQWTAGAVRRDRLATASDILIVISGGEGVQHLVQLYMAQRKPVIALDLNLGASTEVGAGRAVAINQEIASNPDVYLYPKDPQAIGALWANMTTEDGARPQQEVVDALLKLIDELEPPRAFCARLLDPTNSEFSEVDQFFKNIVNPIIVGTDHKLIVSPQAPTHIRWMTAQIFEEIHNASLVIVDLTGIRPNCFIELGYALGRNRRTFITAKHGTNLPFDIGTLECCFWSPEDSEKDAALKFREYFERNITQAPLVPPVTLF